ncbi:MAG: hypothetical protein R2708_10125 [Vicinamibacterales bacterium]
MELDRIPLWPDNHVAVKQLVEHFARYVYLPRLSGPEVLIESVRRGVELITWEHDAFAFAASYDEDAGRYRELRAGQVVTVGAGNPAGLLVKPAVARRQLEAESNAKPADGPDGAGESGGAGAAGPGALPGVAAGGGAALKATLPKRFHGSVMLDATRVGRDASRIAEEVIAHLAGLVGAKVTVILEVEAEVPSGAPENVVRTVTENARTLKFSHQAFEKD